MAQHVRPDRTPHTRPAAQAAQQLATADSVIGAPNGAWNKFTNTKSQPSAAGHLSRSAR
jgi:hypothetical protein